MAGLMEAAGLGFSWHGPADAPVVVLLHSIATNRSLWSLQIPAWSKHFRLLTIDLPGHGTSPRLQSPSIEAFADAVADVLQEQRVETAAVVGLSLGGMVAQALALRHPARITKVVLAHSGAKTLAPVAELWRERIAIASSEGMASLVVGTIERWFTPEFALSAPLHLDWISGLVAGTDLGGFCDAAAAIMGLDLLSELSGLTVPVLVIAGERDTALPVAVAAEIADRLPAARLSLLPTAHLGNVEQPVAFAELVGDFLLRSPGD